MWLWGILALLTVTAYGQVDHSPQWGLSAGSYDSYWGIKDGFPSYRIYDKENLNFGDYDNIKAGQELVQASSYDQLLNYTYFGQYIIHENLKDIYAKTLFSSPETYTPSISRYFRYPSATQNEANVSTYYNAGTGMFEMLSNKQYTLYKYHKYTYPIKDLGISGENVISNTNIKGLIILIHGHNNSAVTNPYANTNWLVLRTELEKTVVKNTNWKVIGYDWAEDAANGEIGLTGVGAIKSAAAAHFHGIHLADSIQAQFQNLQKVHFITHSAGLWAARSACVRLNGSIVTQITALDPFVPSKIITSSPENILKVSDLCLTNGMYRLENYYAVDSTDTFGNESTSQTFTWSSSDVQKRIDWSQEVAGYYGSSTYYYYKDHSGPIQWYADSIASLGATSSAASYIPFRSDQGNYGWSKSLFMNEPRIVYCLTNIVVAPSTTNIITTISKNYNNEINLVDTNDPIKNYWEFKDTNSGQWTALPLTTSQIQLSAPLVKTNYILRYTAFNNAGYESRNIFIRVRSFYEQWAEVSNSLTGSNASALADLSGNGVPNIIKYALGKTPTDKSTPEYKSSLLTNNSKKYLKISVARNGKSEGVSITPEVSGDLQSWKTTEAQTVTDTVSEYSAQDLVPIDSASKRFIRLRFSEQ